MRVIQGRLCALQKGLPAGVYLQRGVFVVVQPGAAQLLVVQAKTQRLDQMQRAAGIGRQTDDVAGIGRNFRLVQQDIEHGGMASAGAGKCIS